MHAHASRLCLLESRSNASGPLCAWGLLAKRGEVDMTRGRWSIFLWVSVVCVCVWERLWESSSASRSVRSYERIDKVSDIMSAFPGDGLSGARIFKIVSGECCKNKTRWLCLLVLSFGLKALKRYASHQNLTIVAKLCRWHAVSSQLFRFPAVSSRRVANVRLLCVFAQV